MSCLFDFVVGSLNTRVVVICETQLNRKMNCWLVEKLLVIMRLVQHFAIVSIAFDFRDHST